MTPVDFRFVTIEGTPLANVAVEIHLAESGYVISELGVVLPTGITHTTDDAGQLTVELVSSESLYHAIVRGLNGLDICAQYSFRVPELVPPATSVAFEDIIVSGGSGHSDQSSPLAFQVEGVAIGGAAITTLNLVGFTVTRVGNTLVLTAPAGTPVVGTVSFDGGTTWDAGILWS